MSPLRRMSSASVARASSTRFFSRITCWDLSGFDQRLGSEACFSISVNCWRSFPASKVLLEGTDFVFQRSVLLFEFFNHGSGLCLSIRCEAHHQRSYTNYRTQAGEPIAVVGIERGYLSECVGRGQCGTR